jgi:hypothetical protein
VKKILGFAVAGVVAAGLLYGGTHRAAKPHMLDNAAEKDELAVSCDKQYPLIGDARWYACIGKPVDFNIEWQHALDDFPYLDRYDALKKGSAEEIREREAYCKDKYAFQKSSDINVIKEAMMKVLDCEARSRPGRQVK